MEPIIITDFELQGKHPYITIFTVIPNKINVFVNLTPMKIRNSEIYNFYWKDGELQWYSIGTEWKNEKAKLLASELSAYFNLNPQILQSLSHNP